MENQLTERQILAAQYLADGIADDFIAKELNVTLTIIKQWQALPAFKEFVQRLRSESESQAVEKIFSLKPVAVAALQELLSSNDSRTRLRAAEIILKYGAE